jgi:hypothetical protein
MEEIQNSPRCDTIKIFISMLNPEKYLSIDMQYYVKYLDVLPTNYKKKLDDIWVYQNMSEM